MFIISTQSDLNRLRQNKTLPPDYLEHLQSYFDQQCKLLLPELPELDEFNLYQHGQMFILEPSDDFRAILGSRIEWVKRFKLEYGILYQIYTMPDNDQIEVYYLEANQCDQKLGQWLEEVTED
jgi:hypothetical protein